MVTKLKKISRHWTTKLIIILIMCVAACQIAYSFIALAERYNSSENVSSFIDPVAALVQPDFDKSHSGIYALKMHIRDMYIAYSKNGDKLIASDSHLHPQSPDPNFLFYATLNSTIQNPNYLDLSTNPYLSTNPTVTSADSVIAQSGFYLTFTNGVLDFSKSSSKLEKLAVNTYSFVGYDEFPNITVGITKDHYDTLVKEWSALHEAVYPLALQSLNCLVFFILGLILLCITAGRTSRDDQLHTLPTDKFFTELYLLGIVGSVFLSLAIYLSLGEHFFSYYNYYNDSIYCFLASSMGAVATLCVVGLLLPMVRKAKAGQFFRGSCIGFCFTILKRIARATLNFFVYLTDGAPYQGLPFNRKMFNRLTTYVILSFLSVIVFVFFAIVFFPFAIIILAFEIWLTYRYLSKNKKALDDIGCLVNQIEKIRNGDLEYVPALSEQSDLYDTCGQLSEISGGMQAAIDSQLKNERMKIELVTNVSHDLKTPLTSIISYVELLSKEELSDTSRDYVAVLAQKSDRLKNIVADLFDLAKSTSGNLEIEAEAIDLRRLIEQSLGDMETEIEKSSLAFKVTLATGNATVWSDGKKLSRVMQNLISNSLKYSLEGSRVFVDLALDGTQGTISIKNTSAVEMDFSAEQVLSRFVRGDKMRASEGSGLGLSIAQSFTTACGGQFDIVIDGDQFKAQLIFDLIEN